MAILNVNLYDNMGDSKVSNVDWSVSGTTTTFNMMNARYHNAGLSDASYLFYQGSGLTDFTYSTDVIDTANSFVNCIHMFDDCTALTNLAIKSDSTVQASYMYANTYALSQAPFSGASEVEADYKYYNSGVKLVAACGPKVTNANNMYAECLAITISNVGESVTDAGAMYKNCSSIGGTAAMTETVVQANSMYEGCTHIAQPKCGSSVTEADNMYNGCIGIAMAPECGPAVTYANNMYNGCIGMQGPPNVSDAVMEASYMYNGCSVMMGSPAVNTALSTGNCMYQGCSVLTGEGAFGPYQYRADNMYNGCEMLENLASEIPSTMEALNSCYKGCSSISGSYDWSTCNPESLDKSATTDMLNGCTGSINITVAIDTSIDNAFWNDGYPTTIDSTATAETDVWEVGSETTGHWYGKITDGYSLRIFDGLDYSDLCTSADGSFAGFRAACQAAAAAGGPVSFTRKM